MASDIAVCTIVGRLVRDAELKYTNSGAAVCNFSMASNWSRKKGEEWVEEVSYFDFVMFGRRAESLHKHLTKGTKLAIAASPRQERWEKDGQKQSRVKFYVDDLNFAGGKSEGGSSSGATEYGSQPGDIGYQGKSDFEDSIPF